MVAEERLYKQFPSVLDPSWVVSFLEQGKFSAGLVRLLRTKSRASDRVLSSMLSVTPKTFVGYTRSISNIKVDTQEHILMLIALLKHGAQVFGSEAAFSTWLETKNVFFDNRPPQEFLNTISGIRMVDDRLVSMEYGDNV